MYKSHLSWRFVAEAMSPIDKDEVLESRIVFEGAAASIPANSFFLMSRFSTIASTTRSELAAASSAEAVHL